MKSSSELRSSLVAMYRSIPSLISILDSDESHVVDYKEELNGDLFSTIAELEPNRILVCHTSVIPSGGSITLWQHNFSVIIRVASSPDLVFKEMLDGIPEEGDGLSMFLTQIDSVYHSMSVPTLQRRVVPLSEKSSFDYWEVNFGFTSRGFE